VATTDGDYTMDHSSALVVIDPQGRQAGLIRPPLVPADIAADLATLTEAWR
jgi:protein SCO1/2